MAITLVGSWVDALVMYHLLDWRAGYVYASSAFIVTM
jgi:hypothetical protein